MNSTPPGVSALLKRENMPEPHYLSEQAYISKFETVVLPYKNDLLKSFGNGPIPETIEISDSSVARERCQSTPSKYPSTGDKPYQCETCKKTFSQQSNLCKHVLIHYGVKPFCCETCGKRFTQQANLIKHKRIHTGDKPYVCRICLRQFSQNANLKKHIHLHTGEKRYRCEFCDKTFVQQANLDRHRRTHTGEKPFLCNVCQKRFTQKGNLLKHEVIHFVKETSRQVSQLPKASEKGSIESLLSTSEAMTPEISLHESYHRRLSIPMMLTSREKVFLKR